MKYFFYKEIKINLSLQLQTAPSGRHFKLIGCINDLQKSNYKFSYYTYIFKYLDKSKMINEFGDEYYDYEKFGFYFENQKVLHKLGHKEINKLF